MVKIEFEKGICKSALSVLDLKFIDTATNKITKI